MILPGELLRAKTYNGLRYDFYAWGVVAYADTNREVMRARLADVVSGTVDASGIWLATSGTGVWHLPFNLTGDNTAQLANRYSIASVVPLQSNVCSWIDSDGSDSGDLLIAGSSGVDFITDSGGTGYKFYDGSGVDRCAISSSNIAYTPSTGGIHYRNHPLADWLLADVTVLTTASTPAIIGNTVQALEFGTDLFIATSAGTTVYDGSGVTDIAAATEAEASSVNTSIGTATGTLSAIETQDGVYYSVDELNGTPGFQTEINFDAVSTVTNSLNIYGRYQGNVAHTVNVEAYNFNTLVWDVLGTLVSSASDALHSFTLTDADHRSAAEVRTRITHTSNGNSSHDLYLDHVYLTIVAAPVNDTRSIYPTADATRTAGHVAIGTSDDAGGGQCEIYDLAGAADNFSRSGDTLGIWLDEELQALICDDTLNEFLQYKAVTPGYGAQSVPRNYTFYAEIIDSLGGIQATPTLKINGQTVAATVSAISHGYSIEYSGTAGYDTRVQATISGVDAKGFTVSRSFWFRTVKAPDLTATVTPPPNIVAIADIGLVASEADEQVGTVYVIWGDEISSELIASDAQAEAVGQAALDETTYHSNLRNIKLRKADDAGEVTGELQRGDTVKITVDALNETLVTGFVRNVKRTETIDDGLSYQITLAIPETL